MTTGRVIVINIDRHTTPAGHLELTVTGPSAFALPYRPGRLPEPLLNQLAQCQPAARTPEEHAALRQALDQRSVASAAHAVTLHLLYLRRCCQQDNTLGQSVKQLAGRVRAGQRLALACRCVTDIYVPGVSAPPAAPCHAVNIARAIAGYAQKPR